MSAVETLAMLRRANRDAAILAYRARVSADDITIRIAERDGNAASRIAAILGARKIGAPTLPPVVTTNSLI